MYMFQRNNVAIQRDHVDEVYCSMTTSNVLGTHSIRTQKENSLIKLLFLEFNSFFQAFPHSSFFLFAHLVKRATVHRASIHLRQQPIHHRLLSISQPTSSSPTPLCPNSQTLFHFVCKSPFYLSYISEHFISS